MNNQLLVGLVLIAFGIGLAILAYMILNNRRQDSGEEGSEAEQVPEPAVIEGFTSEKSDDEDLPAPLPSPAMDAAEESVDSPQIEEDEPDSPVESKEPPPPRMPAAGPRIQVATLLRDEVSGSLIVKIGDEEFDDPEALKASRYWTRLEYAARDLSTWVQKPETVRPPSVVRETEVPDRKPASMIEQINDILQVKVEATGRSDLAVRLVEGPGGIAKVLIGVNSYEIADVPNPEIKALIREAVADWESTQ